jgi:uncharacterized protein
MSTPTAIAALQREKYISLETFKRDGSGVKTPVWFVELDGALAIFTNRESYKVKRLARNPACKFAACGVAGGLKNDTWFDGSAVLLQGDDEIKAVHAALRKKYGMQMLAADVGSKITGSNAKRYFYRIDL